MLTDVRPATKHPEPEPNDQTPQRTKNRLET